MSLAHGVIKKGDKVPCPVDDQGQFTEEVTDFSGMHVKVSCLTIYRSQLRV